MGRLLVIDIDGVIVDFKKIDHTIINEIYGNYKLVKVIDRMLWFFNGMDIITNTFDIFRLRLKIYSILSKTNYSENMKTYKNRYCEMSKRYFSRFLNNEFKTLKYNDFEIIFLSCDLFDAFLYEDIKVVRNKRDYVSRFIYKNYNEIYVVGNNYMDDMQSGLKLRHKCVVPVNIFYVGKGKIMSLISKMKKIHKISSVQEFVEIILKHKK